MESLGRAMEIATRVINSNVAINTVLISAFGLLSMRSVHQQRQIEGLEAEKENLIKKNKAIKKSIWESKQQLYADAGRPGGSAVSLETLKSIYGDVTVPAVADAGKGSGKTATKILI